MKKNITRNICLTSEDNIRILRESQSFDLSVSQYLSDSPYMLYKIGMVLNPYTTLKIIHDGVIEYISKWSDIPDEYMRRRVKRLECEYDVNPFDVTKHCSLYTITLKDEAT